MDVLRDLATADGRVRTRRALDRRWRQAREATLRRLAPRRVREVRLVSPAGHDLPCHLHLPAGPGPYPGVLLLPGGLDGLASLEGLRPVLTAPGLARAGFATLAFSPSGRDGAPGESDLNGPLHQAEAVEALRTLLTLDAVDRSRVAVASLSFGLVLAVAALTRQPDLGRRVRLLVDWEGPGHRRWFRRAGIGAPPDDDAWWTPREAIRRVHELPCAYHRLQSAWDHVHGRDAEIGWELVVAAAKGGVPEVRYNGLPGPFDDPARFPLAPLEGSAQTRILTGWLAASLRVSPG